MEVEGICWATAEAAIASPILAVIQGTLFILREPLAAFFTNSGILSINPQGNYPLTVGMGESRLIDDRMGGMVKYYLAPRLDIDMRIPDEMRKCVVFLAVEQGAEKKCIGTAFFVEMKSPVAPLTFYYLVTAKHCAKAVQDIQFWITVNQKSGGVREIDAEGARWFYHPTDEEHVDVAVLPITPPSGLDSMSINNINFFTPQNYPTLGIGTGDEVFITGLFSLAKGSRRNMPIVRLGSIAMMPEGKIPTRDFGEIDAYLVETRSFGGVSGSPVFVRPTTDTGRAMRGSVVGGSRHFYLLGLMHGHWEIDPNAINQVNIKGVDEGVNLGIAIVVPTYKIVEVLNHPEIMAMRKQKQDDWKKEQGLPKADTASTKNSSDTFTESDFENALTKATRKLSDQK